MTLFAQPAATHPPAGGHTHTYTYMYVWMFVWMYGCMYVCMHACMHVCRYAPTRQPGYTAGASFKFSCSPSQYLRHSAYGHKPARTCRAAAAYGTARGLLPMARVA
jgi:hypothetical protein